jgi:hydroxymethylbilane synthase
MTIIRIATRASALAQWQARHAARLLRQQAPGLRCKLVPIAASGDKDLATPLYAMPAIGVFCKEVHQAVLAGQADIGVHSCKDLPTQSPTGISLAAILPRHDPRDALIGYARIHDLPHGATIGSSSLRRRHQLQYHRGDLQLVDLRGNVESRLRKLREGQADATLLACAGLQRMGLRQRAGAHAIPPRDMVPAPAQGAIAIDCRSDAHGLRRLLSRIDHTTTRLAVGIERDALALLQGGCSLPFGCLAHRQGCRWQVQAYLFHDDEHRHWSGSGSAADLPRRLVDHLLAR